MANKRNDAVYGYREFRADVKNGKQKSLYVFHGEEGYLLRDALAMLRGQIAPGTEEFNLRRFEGKTMSLNDLADAVNTFPMFSDRVLVEVWDYDLGRLDDQTRRQLTEVLAEVGGFVSVVFVFDTLPFKLDGRVKANAELKKLLTVVEFCLQDTGNLLGWIRSHFAAEGKDIAPAAAEYLAVMTGGQMTLLASEIDKLSAYTAEREITKRDIDAVVTPVLNTAVYEMMGRMIERDYDGAARKLAELAAMNEAPQRILYDVTATLRQLYGARLCMDEGVGQEAYTELFDMKRREFLVRRYFATARGLGAEQWKRALAIAADTAYKLNSAPLDGRELMSELLARLAVCIEEKR